MELWSAIPCPARPATQLRALNVVIFDCSRATEIAATMTRTELRAHALAKTPWREVLLLEPGTFPLVAPELLFANRAFKASGALFFHGQKKRARPGVWKLCGMDLPKNTASAALMVLDRSRCWSALSLWNWIGGRNYFFRGYVDGDGGAAQLAFAKLNLPLSISRDTASTFWSAELNTPAPPMVERHRRTTKRALLR
jgi:hypothetical protein